MRPHTSLLRSLLGFCAVGIVSGSVFAAEPGGVLPLGKDGKPLNLDFEAGDLRDWKAEGDAFEGQPVRGDAVKIRRSDMTSGHTGNFWVGSYEVKGDNARGVLSSVPKCSSSSCMRSPATEVGMKRVIPSVEAWAR